MPKHKIEVVFSLIFFFFAVFLFLSVLSFAFVKNFDNVLVVLLQPGGFFICATRAVLGFGFFAALWLFWRQGANLVHKFALFCAAVFLSLIAANVFFSPTNDVLETILDHSSLRQIILMNTEMLVVDSAVFVFFVLIPIFDFFYKKISLNVCFYQIYLRDVTPSLNISIMFLFGFLVQRYDFTDALDYVPIGLCGLAIAAVLVVIFYSSLNIQIFINTLLLLACFGIFLSVGKIDVNLYYARILFYALGLVCWMFVVVDRLEEG